MRALSALLVGTAARLTPSTENQFNLLKRNLVGVADLWIRSVEASEHSRAEKARSRRHSIHGRRQAMTKFKLFIAAATLPLMFATPVFAQAAIQEPGMYAFYHPNNDVLNGGRPTPAARLNARTLMRLNRRAAGF
jgi:hypothetical protein